LLQEAQQDFSGDRITPPTMPRRGRGGCGATSRPKTISHNIYVVSIWMIAAMTWSIPIPYSRRLSTRALLAPFDPQAVPHLPPPRPTRPDRDLDGGRSGRASLTLNQRNRPSTSICRTPASARRSHLIERRLTCWALLSMPASS
jgi:hypothetical protein